MDIVCLLFDGITALDIVGPYEVLQRLPDADVKFVACQMTVDLFDFDKSDFIENVEYGGAATFMEFAGDTDVCLFI